MARGRSLVILPADVLLVEPTIKRALDSNVCNPVETELVSNFDFLLEGIASSVKCIRFLMSNSAVAQSPVGRRITDFVLAETNFNQVTHRAARRDSECGSTYNRNGHGPCR